MALSDTCFEALESLKDDLIGYADWDYSPVELSRIVNAMYELATFMVGQDMPPNSPKDNLNEVVDGVVVASILDKAHKEKSEKILSVLASIAKVNAKLSNSIDAMVENLSSKERMLDVIKDPRLMEQLKEIQKLRNT